MQKKTASIATVFIQLLIIAPAAIQSQDHNSHTKKGGESQASTPGSTAEAASAAVAEDEMPTVWFFMGREFWYPNRFNMSEALNDARAHYRKGQLRAAQAQIAEAITWLKLAKANANKKSQAELQTVIVDLSEIGLRLDGEKSVSAKELNRTISNANLALARHHFSKANQLAEKSDLVNASRRLIAAADHMKNAANFADVTPSPVVGTFRNEYSPYGMVDETLELTPQQLKEDLEKLAEALKNLGTKLEQKSK